MLAVLFFTHLHRQSPEVEPWRPSQTWAFNPAADDFRSDAFLDLRGLNEKVAGETGFLNIGADGEFRTGKGDPIRFWAVNSGVGSEIPFNPRPLGRKTAPDLDRHARWLAKRGVNMVRFHGHLNPEPSQSLTDINEAQRDHCWRMVASMKKAGIYTTISPYWAVPAKISDRWGVAGGAKQSALGLLFFDPVLQKGYRAWLKKLFAEKNPYTGIPLSQDASVGVIQIQNEDSLLFWTVNGIAGPQRKQLGKLFGGWLTKKYGSALTAFQAWGSEKMPGDSINEGVFDFRNVWELTQPRKQKNLRLEDQLQFWAETMHKFNADTAVYLRQELGCKQLINAGNWRSADNLRMNDVERWSYSANEVDAVNHYFGGLHKGPNEGWAIVNGDKFTNQTAVKNPTSLPINLKQTQGHPIMITESSWTMPNGHASEGPFLVSAYSALNGIGPYFWFATGDDEWSQPSSANGYLPSQQKWICMTPDMAGTFPAAALVYRMRYVAKAPPAVVEHRSLADMWQGKVPIIAEYAGFDPNRDMPEFPKNSPLKSSVNPLAFLVGPVKVVFGSDASNSKVVDLQSFIDTANGTTKSLTREVVMNSQQGICTVNTPKAQGVTGFLGGTGNFKLDTISVSSRNRFGSVWVVCLDQKPLSESGKVLVQFGSESRPTGWQDRVVMGDDKKKSVLEVVSYGSAPWAVVSADLDMTIKNKGLKKATVLDMNGNAFSSLPIVKTPTGMRITFPDKAMYVILS